MDMIAERYGLACGRIKEISVSQEVASQYKDYFKKTADFILQLIDIYENRGKVTELEKLREENKALYMDVSKAHYEESYANPTYAAGKFGLEYGQLLSLLYTEQRAMIPYVFELLQEEMVIRMELFVEVYSAYAYSEADEKESAPAAEEIREMLYWFVSDYVGDALRWRVRTQVDSDEDFAAQIVMESDLKDLRYLYQYGEYISPEVEQMAQYLNTLSEERIQMIADTYTEGYRIGFVKANIDLGKKETVDIRYMIGFERIVRAAIKNFEKMGLKPVIFRTSTSIFHSKGIRKVGYFGADINKQFLYDHRDDMALFLDKKFVNRRLEVLKAAYEEVKDKAAKFAGPAVIEVFGEEPFAPVAKKEACSLSKEQQKLSAEYTNASAQLTNQYIKGDERSFTIIAFPVPDIGEQFAEIFDETVKLNTLDYTTYERIQAKIIDTLNKAEYVEIKGMNGNKTDLRVALCALNNPEKEAKFENCVADVNIPVGEVFTSPKLEGTNGKLHVSRVFLNELEYHNLEIDFTEGMIAEYACTNFENAEENKNYIKANVLRNHDTLPMGEFAIGTNTTAYMTAKKYDIANRFPILIAEKTGPHFAVGDTCYARSEEVRVYNEDGKEIVAKDNSVSILRKTDPSKAYFACHTDITIPYDELGSIIAYAKEGTAYTIIEKGRFVLEGTEELNTPFDS